MTCKDCIHYDVCSELNDLYEDLYADGSENCSYFKDKSKFIELPCKVGQDVYIVSKIDYTKRFWLAKFPNITETQIHQILANDKYYDIAIITTDKEEAESKLKELNND